MPYANRNREGKHSCLALFVALMLTASTAIAGDDSAVLSAEKRLEQASLTVGKLDQPGHSETKQDVELIRGWMSQGQALLASGNHERVALVLERIEAKTAYVKVKQQRLAAEAEMRAAEQVARAAQEAANAAKAAASDAHEKMKALEAKGL